MVKFMESELVQLKKQVFLMWDLVSNQLEYAGRSVLAMDKELASQVMVRERKVNAFELRIDSDAEDIIALYNPVAIDLRFTLAMLKINNNLERLGDFADGIARFVSGSGQVKLDPKLLEDMRLEEMASQVQSMLSSARQALENEDISLATSVFAKDNIVDEINARAPHVLADYIRQHPDDALLGLNLLSVVRKLERSGDHITNMAEEIVFFIDAKVLKHSGKREE